MKPAIAFVAILLAAGCASHESAKTAPAASETGQRVPGAVATTDALYAATAATCLAAHLEWRPQAGVALGLHAYDGRVTDVSAASIAAEHARLLAARAAIAGFDSAALSADARVSQRNLLAGIDGELFLFDVAHAYTRNPMTYTDLIDANVYLKRAYAPLAQRALAAAAVLRKMPAVLASARLNLAAVLPAPLIETAIINGTGAVGFLRDDMTVALADLKDAAALAEINAARRAAADAMEAYLGWLKTDRMPQATQDFALGAEAFTQMLRGNECITQSPDEILRIGMDELKREQEKFATAARAIDPTKPPIEVFKAIQHDHPTAESLLPDARKNLEAIRQYLIDHDLISVPSAVRVRVEETPRYARATGFASMDTPGPFEGGASEAYYYITPTEPEWDAKHKDEWLTSFNYYTTDVVSIHEAYPGHYVQFLHLNASNADRVSKVFGSYAFIEGWAHYTEQMMLENGFGQGSDLVRGAKYCQAQSDEALLRICRLCASINMHCHGWTQEQATKFFVDNCYYEEAPAKAEALRGASDPGYCFYTLGKLEILKLRADWMIQEGNAFTLKRFHDTLLAHGMPPIRALRERMLRDPAQWDALFW